MQNNNARTIADFTQIYAERNNSAFFCVMSASFCAPAFLAGETSLLITNIISSQHISQVFPSILLSKFSLQNYFWRSRHSPEEASRCQKLIGNCTRFAASYSTGTIRRTARVTDNLQLTTTFVTYDLQLMTYDLFLN